MCLRLGVALEIVTAVLLVSVAAEGGTPTFGTAHRGVPMDEREGGQQERGHIPGSQHVDLLQDLSDPASPIPLMMPPAERFAVSMSCVGVGDGCRVVLYDSQMTMWAARVWWMLRAFGFTAAAVLDGGWQAWSNEACPKASGPEPEPRPATFIARPRPGLFVSKDEVLAALDQPQVCIVNALDREVHRGERQDHARAGHMPGARNVPFSELVDPETHRYPPLEQLRQMFEGVLSATPDKVITYCGAAIAASSDAFALGLLGSMAWPSTTVRCGVGGGPDVAAGHRRLTPP